MFSFFKKSVKVAAKSASDLKLDQQIKVLAWVAKEKKKFGEQLRIANKMSNLRWKEELIQKLVFLDGVEHANRLR